MRKHVEGGWYKECLLSSAENDGRPLFSSIYFLLEKGDVSRFHRLKTEEVWYYHAGDPMTLYLIDGNGNLSIQKLGLDVKNGELPQIKIPAGIIFGAEVGGRDFSLVGCMCAPAFRFEEFELLSRYDLLRKYPKYAYIIKKLSKD